MSVTFLDSEDKKEILEKISCVKLEDNAILPSMSPSSIGQGWNFCVLTQEQEIENLPEGGESGIFTSMLYSADSTNCKQIWQPNGSAKQFVRVAITELLWGNWVAYSTEEAVNLALEMLKTTLIGNADDPSTEDTIKGAKTFAMNMMTEHIALANSKFATKEELEQEVAEFDFIKVVDVLPEVGLPNRFFLVPKQDTQNQDLFDEYIWVNKGTEEEPDWCWEWVTTKQVKIDLTAYATKKHVQEMLLERSKQEHEVGSLYLTMNYTNPSEILGFGVWQLIAQDRFLIGAGNKYLPGNTGGEETHTLSIEEMPSHVHKISSSLQWADAVGNVQGGSKTYYKRSEDQTTQLAGGSKPHNNMPPYIAVYMWQRTE